MAARLLLNCEHAVSKKIIKKGSAVFRMPDRIMSITNITLRVCFITFGQL